MRRITLGKGNTAEGLAVLLDNLTLHFSARLLRLERTEHSPYGAISEEHVDASVLAEVCALSTLVDALILYDTIYVPSDYADRWYDSLPQIHEVITLVDISSSERTLIQEQTKEMSDSYSYSKYFHRYLRYLQSRDLEGAVLRTAYHYHGAGAPWMEEAASHFGTESHLSKGGVPVVGEASHALELLGRYDGHSILPEVSMLLASGAFFYQAIASMLDIAYLPHPFRAPFCLFEAWAARAVKGVTYSSIRLLEEKRSESAQAVNALLGEGICDLFIPALLVMVLKQSQGPNDILQKTLAIRASSAARRFRESLRSMVDSLKKGNVESVRLNLKEVQDKVASLGQRTIPKINFTIGLSPSVDFSFEPTPDKFKSLFSRDRLFFVKSIWASMAEVATLEQEMTRVWGNAFREREADLRRVWQWLRLDPAKIKLIDEQS